MLSQKASLSSGVNLQGGFIQVNLEVRRGYRLNINNGSINKEELILLAEEYEKKKSLILNKILENINKNSYRILGLPVNASEDIILKKAESLKRKTRLGYPERMQFGIDLLEELEVRENDIQAATGRLMNPKLRAKERLFWFSDESDWLISYCTKQFRNLDDYLGVFEKAKTVIKKHKVAEIYEISLMGLIFLALDDFELKNTTAWGEIYDSIQLVFENDMFWEYQYLIETQGSFTRPMGNEIEVCKQKSVIFLLKPLTQLIEEHLYQSNLKAVIRGIEIISDLDILADLHRELTNDIHYAIEDEIKNYCSTIMKDCSKIIKLDENDLGSNKEKCQSALELFEKVVLPRYEIIRESDDISHPIYERVTDYISDFKLNLAIYFTWGNDYLTAEKLLKESKNLTKDLAIKRKINQLLKKIRPAAVSQLESDVLHEGFLSKKLVGKSKDTEKEEKRDYQKKEKKDDNYHSYRTFAWSNGDKYEGEWKQGKRHGWGLYSWSGGDKYEGEWKDNKMHGWGILTWLNGSKYEGEWKDGKRHGWGIFASFDGLILKGEWENDFLKRESKDDYLHPDNPTKFTPRQIVRNSNSGKIYIVSNVKGENVTVITKDGGHLIFLASDLEIVEEESKKRLKKKIKRKKRKVKKPKPVSLVRDKKRKTHKVNYLKYLVLISVAVSVVIIIMAMR